MGSAVGMRPPWLVWLCLVWRIATLTPSTTALPALGFTDRIVPSLPLSLPARTITLSPFLSFAAILQHLRGERDDFHELLGAQLAHDRPEDTGTDRFIVVVQDNSRVAVKADGGAIFAADFLGGAHADGLADVTLLHATARDGFLDGHDNDVAHRRISALGTTQNLDALNPASTGVVSNIQIGLHLDHMVSPDLWGNDPRVSIKLSGYRLVGDNLPAFRFRLRRTFNDPDRIADLDAFFS